MVAKQRWQSSVADVVAVDADADDWHEGVHENDVVANYSHALHLDVAAAVVVAALVGGVARVVERGRRGRSRVHVAVLVLLLPLAADDVFYAYYYS